ncbi:hypothetical protein Dimus_002612 [Dionaea muscipula]
MTIKRVLCIRSLSLLSYRFFHKSMTPSRLRLGFPSNNYHGNESNGKIRISGVTAKRWLQPKLVPSMAGKQAELGLSHLWLGKAISHQQRNIRTGNLSLY